MPVSDKTRKVFYHHVGPIHTYMKSLFNNPPKGYSFILPDSRLNTDSSVQRASKRTWLKWIYRNVLKSFFNVFPIFMKSHSMRIPRETDLVLSTGTVIEEQKAWIMLILDSPFCMAGNDSHVFRQNLSRISEALASSNCKAIIVHTSHSLRIMKRFFPKEIISKTHLVHPGLPLPKKINPKKSSNKLRLLFMGSINNPHEFYMKGGLEALETVKLLRSKGYPVELTVRCKAPQEVKSKYSENYVKYIESFISEEELNQLYQNTDLLLMPGYGGYMIMAYFEAFSRGIPIIGLDAFGVSDFIQNGKNGFVIPLPNDPILNSENYPVNARSSKFLKIIKNPDPKLINRIALYLQPLFEDSSLLKRMQAATYMTFVNKFSQAKQNSKLKKILDEAINEN